MDRITFRPGDLSKPLAARLAKLGLTASQYLRGLLAADLRRKPPAMRGQVQNLKQYQGSTDARTRRKAD